MKETIPFMNAAIEQARQGATPFGCVIVKKNTVITAAFNTVQHDHDVTAHAEINAIRKLQAQKKRTTFSGYTLYTTCEPCPMCMAACLYAGISTVVFGTSIQQVKQYLPQIDIGSHEVVAKSPQRMVIILGMLATDCLQLFEEFQSQKGQA